MVCRSLSFQYLKKNYLFTCVSPRDIKYKKEIKSVMSKHCMSDNTWFGSTRETRDDINSHGGWLRLVYHNFYILPLASLLHLPPLNTIITNKPSYFFLDTQWRGLSVSCHRSNIAIHSILPVTGMLLSPNTFFLMALTVFNITDTVI